ncbi:MAG TPA: tetratricopeptide repeat protein, partial [Gemmatimonadales bacterium]|nr:tetratricopeptide repeat protein [Gemmatimonadales bacterium]
VAVDASPLEIVPTSFDGKLEQGGITLEGLETTIHGVETEGDAVAPEGIIEFERSADAITNPGVVDGLVTPETASPKAIHAITLDGLEATSVELPPIETASEVDMGVAGVSGSASDGIIFLDQGSGDPLGERAVAEAQLERGDRSAGIASLERALAGYQQEEEWPRAWQVATELIQAEPRAIDRYQTRVEIAARMRDRDRLCQSYQELGDALIKEGSTDKAVAVFRRVLELDEGHAAARAALRTLAPEAPASETTPEGYIDLGAMLIDDAPRTTRMRTETTAISENEDETFREALAEFKRALDQNLPVEDHQTHYDLGVAFKEMGLLDEAISEFQKALRSPEGRLRTSEALGQAFFDQGRPAVAEAVLRAVEKGDEGDSEKIGVLYWLGRSQEAQGKTRQAVQCYERVIAVDVGFEDAADRLTRIGTGQGG